jgi:glycerate dehydrogenase
MLGNELCGKTLGVIGLGSIGSWMARIGAGFGMRVIGCSRTKKNLDGVIDAELVEVLAESDIVMIAVEINDSTKNLLDRARLCLMKRGAALVNITSNQVLDENAVAEMLQNGHLACAAFDDISHSGYDDGIAAGASPLLAAPNVVLSPQAGWYTLEAQQRLLEMVVENVEAFAAGRPRNVLNP